MKITGKIFTTKTWAFLLLLFAVSLVYSNTIHAPFTFDDAQIVDNYFIQITDITPENLQQIATLSPNKRRLLPNISFALNYYFAGYNVIGFHLVNILLHIGVGFSFYLLARKTLGLLPASLITGRKAEIALAAALIWALHPLQTNGVTYIVQRMTSMASLFFLLSLLSYIKGRTVKNGMRKIFFFLSAFVLGTMALLSKENSGMLPVMIVGYEFFFLRPADANRKERLKILAAAGVLFIIFAIICWTFLGSDPLNAIVQGYGRRDFTLYQRLLTQSRIVTHYLSLLLLPLPAKLNLAYDFRLSTGLLTPIQTFPAIIFVTALATLIFPLYRRDRLTAFAFFWFLGNLFVESTVIPLELIFEHRMYMPSMFPILAGTFWCYRISGTKNCRILLLVTLSFLALFTWQRNTVWQSEISIWTDIVQKSPALPRAYVNLAKAYGEKGEHERAETLLLQASNIAPEDVHTLLSMGAALENLNRHAEALDFYRRALQQQGIDEAKAHRNLSGLYLRMNTFDKALIHAREANRLNPYNYEAFILLAAAYFKSGNLLQAERTLKQALGLFPAKGDIYVQLGVIHEHQNRLAEAVNMLKMGLASREVDRARAYNTLGIVHWRQRNYSLSVTAAQKAIEINPQLVDAYLTLGITYEDMGHRDLALQQFTRGWQQGLDVVGIFNGWAMNFLNSNQADKAEFYLLEAIKLEPGRPESHDNLASVYQVKGMSAQAHKEREIARSLRNR